MRKTVVFLTALFTLIACNRKDKEIIKPVVKENPLLQFYKDTTFSELYVYPDTTYGKSKYLFKGKMIDSLTCAKLPKSIMDGRLCTEGFYGIYSFKFDKNNTGLITRTPGEYDSSVISLWIYNDKSQTITRSVRLANIFGDAGDFDVYNSWLFSEKDNALKVLMYEYHSYDHSVDDRNDTIVDVTKDYLLLNVKANATDTLSKNPDELKKRFPKQLEKMSL